MSQNQRGGFGGVQAGYTPGYGQQYPQGNYGYAPPAPQQAERAITLDDVVIKTAITLLVAVLAGAATVVTQSYVLMLPALIVGLVVSLIIIFKQKASAALTLTYAAAEGVVLGGITYFFDRLYPGIAFQAILGTVGVFVGMLFVYKIGAVRVTPRTTKFIVGATVGVFVMMLANLIIGLFGGSLGIRDGGPIAIVFSLVVIGVAALNLLLDFEQANDMIRSGMPSKWAWYAAFGLMTTLVWLYLEILRLLSYLQRD
jgi:uncharacterized YccA/Bax inhibitor family protein